MQDDPEYPSSTGMAEKLRPFRLVLIFAALASLYLLSMFYRVSTAVIAPHLIQDLNLDAETLGLLGGAYFYCFALMQFPLGPILDRIGPRFVITSFPLIGALGAFLFASGKSFGLVLLGRILIGTGMASVLMSSLKIFILRFPPEKFATLSAVIVSIGTLGSILAASPLAYLSATLGWRTTFLFTGGISVGLALLAFLFLGSEKKRGPDSAPSSPRGPSMGVFQSIRWVLRSVSFWQIGALAFFSYGTIISLQGLWLGPFLTETQGYSSIEAGKILTLIPLGALVGGPIGGRLSDRTPHSQKSVLLGGLGLYCLGLFCLSGILLKTRNPYGYGFLFFWLGFFNGFLIVMYSHLKTLFPVSISGTVMTLANFFTMAGGAIFMPSLGGIIKSFPRVNQAYPADAYYLSFLICFLGSASSLVFYAFCKKGK